MKTIQTTYANAPEKTLLVAHLNGLKVVGMKAFDGTLKSQHGGTLRLRLMPRSHIV